jgi:hypothetical protein
MVSAGFYHRPQLCSGLTSKLPRVIIVAVFRQG